MRSTAAKNDADHARMEAAVGLDDTEWFLAEVEHDVKAFRKIRAERLQKAEALKAKEKEYNERVRRNFAEATSGFVSNHVPFLGTSADSTEFWDALKGDVDTHAKRIAQDVGCDVSSVLRVIWYDMPRA